MPIHNKLVRDNIPAIIAQSGKKCTTRILDDHAFKTELQKKFSEEITEYQNAQDNKSALEELADLLELIHAAAELHGATINEVEQIRINKAKKNGAFKEKNV